LILQLPLKTSLALNDGCALGIYRPKASSALRGATCETAIRTETFLLLAGSME